MTVSLNSAEKELLEKLGINIDTLTAAKHKTKQSKDADKRPVTIDLSGISEQVNVVCKCCGNKSTMYLDYIKRVDMEGYTIKTVAKPTNDIKRERSSIVNKCEYCKDEMLSMRCQEALIQMIKNLRRV
jgi:hypothetical protein